MGFSISNIISDSVIKAFYLTLLHSLWQGIILAAVAGFIMLFTRNLSSVKRYIWLIAVFALFASATVCTFLIELKSVTPRSGIDLSTSDIILKNSKSAFTAPVAVGNITITHAALNFLNKNAANIVFVWFLIVCCRSIQLVTGLFGLYHIRHKSIFQVGDAWQDKVDTLATNLRIKRVVRMAESGIAKVPMVIGHIKPLILIPIGLLTTLPPAEIEAILIHELAHIHRKDYLINLLISFLEIVLFFNPAVLWVATLIRTERENCCDDIAVAHTSCKVSYIRALVSCQEYQLQAPAYAMALKGNKGHLVNRVKRMLSNHNRSLNMMERALLAIGVVGASLVMAGFSGSARHTQKVTTTTVTTITKTSTGGELADKHKQMDNIAVKPVPTDTTSKNMDIRQGVIRIYQPDEFGNGTSITINKNLLSTHIVKQKDVLYQLNYENDNLISVQINGKTIPAQNLAAYLPVINGLWGTADKEPVDVKDAQLTDEAQRINNIKIANQAALAMADNAADAQSARTESLRAARRLKALKILAKIDSIRQNNINRNISVSVPVTANVPVVIVNSGKQQNTESKGEDFISELINDGVLSKRADHLSFKLSTTEFILNGKKQSESIYQKYKDKYVAKGKSHWSWLYNYNRTSDDK